MKVSKKLLSMLLVVMLLLSAVPFQAFAEEVSTVSIDVYEVDLENNANLVKTVTGVNVEGYASQDDMVNDVYGPNWTKYQYRDGGDGTAMLRVWPLETPDEKQVFQLRIQHNNGTSDYTLVDIYEGDAILAAIKAAGVKLSYAEHDFVGYSFNHTGNAADYINVYHTAEASLAKNGVIYVYADWEKITDDDNDNDDVVYDVVLKIYTNGKTSSPAKTVSMDNYGIDGKITRDEVELCVKKYYNTSKATFYGLFTADTWDNGDYTDSDDAVYTVELDPDHTNYIYVMVKNATAYTNGNADTSNPKTGDAIFAAVGTMMSSAAAAAYLFLNKKRIVK